MSIPNPGLKPPVDTGGGSIASLPGRVLLKPAIYDLCYPGARNGQMRALFITLILLIPAIFLLTSHGCKFIAGGIVLLLLLIPQAAILDRTQLKSHLYHGCANPALVVSASPFLIAVFADITATRGVKFPVVKIMPAPLEQVPGRSFTVGDLVPTISTYHGPSTEGHWTDFHPIPACCATDETRALARLENFLHYEEEGWDALHSALSSVPKPYAPGLYSVPKPVSLQEEHPAGQFFTP